jgi:membrane protein implicated in regulation of membrane protease activity
MELWLFWFLVGVSLLAVEALVAFTLYAGAVSLGAFPAAIVAAVGGSVELQVAVFAFGAGISLLLVRPLARRHLRTPQLIRTGTDSLIGARATVMERVDDDQGVVKIRGGEIWSARASNPDQRFEAGSQVIVETVKGVAVLVRGPEVTEQGEEGDGE